MPRLLAVLILAAALPAPTPAQQGDLAERIRARLGAPDLGRGRAPAAPKIVAPAPRALPVIPGMTRERAGSGRTAVPEEAPEAGGLSRLEAFKKGWHGVMSPVPPMGQDRQGLAAPDFLRSYGLLKTNRFITELDAPLYARYWQSIGLAAAHRGDRETVRMAISQIRRLNIPSFVLVRDRLIAQLKQIMPPATPGGGEAEKRDPFNYRLSDRLSQQNAPTGDLAPGTRPPGGR